MDKFRIPMMTFMTGPIDMLDIQNIVNLMTLRRCVFNIMQDKAKRLQYTLMFFLIIFLFQDYVLLQSIKASGSCWAVFTGKNVPK